MQAFEMRYYRRLLNISYKDHVTNEEVRKKIQAAIREYDELLALVKKRKKMDWPCLNVFLLQGTMKGKKEEMNRRRSGKTILKSEQEWNSPAHLGQLKTD